MQYKTIVTCRFFLWERERVLQTYSNIFPAQRERERAANIHYCNSFPAYSNFFQTIINQIFAFLYSTCQTSIKIAGPTVFCWVTLGLSPNLAVNELVVNCTALTMATHLCIRARSFKRKLFVHSVNPDTIINDYFKKSRPWDHYQMILYLYSQAKIHTASDGLESVQIFTTCFFMTR